METPLPAALQSADAHLPLNSLGQLEKGTVGTEAVAAGKRPTLPLSGCQAGPTAG